MRQKGLPKKYKDEFLEVLHDKQGAFMKLLNPKPTSAWWSRSQT